jgi:exopolyphosphatase/pppGpp-phosphohydrolase
VARKHAATARRLGCSRVVVVVTSPGRQAANADELLEALAGIRGATVRVLSAEEEGTFAYRGALAKVVGRQLGPEELAVGLRIAAERPSRRLAKTFDLSDRRARTLAAGALLLSSAQSLLGVPLDVARGGLREGVALSLVEEIVVAA